MDNQNNKNQPAVKQSVIKRKFSGLVVSDKMNKTRVVMVESVKIFPKYKKRYKVKKRLKVHDEKNRYKVGDKVQFIECRPTSRVKKGRRIYHGLKTEE